MLLELDITHMLDESMFSLSGSVVEHGENAGSKTWNNCLQYAQHTPLLKSKEEIEHARNYFKDIGPWSDGERAKWSDNEVQALIIQLIAGDIREMEAYDSFEEYEQSEQVSHNIFKSEDKFYYTLDH